MTFEAQSISIVIPTFQRREIVVESVKRLNNVSSPIPVEIVVVVDGSDDGTLEALQGLNLRWPLQVLYHNNRGLAATRNRGAMESSGDIIVFIDDDMRADPGLVQGHLRAYARGADAVVGKMALDVSSPDTILADQVASWCDELAAQLGSHRSITEGHEIFGGHLSIRRNIFDQLCGFEESYNRNGRYGNEDLDFGDRIINSGATVLYSAEACTSQYYSVRASDRIDQWYDLASADEQLLAANRKGSDDVLRRQKSFTIKKAGLRSLVTCNPRIVKSMASLPRLLVCRRIDAGCKDAWTVMFYDKLLRLFYTLGRATICLWQFS